MGKVKPLFDEHVSGQVVGPLLEYYEERLVKHHRAMEKGLSDPEYREVVGRCKEIRDTVKKIIGRNVEVMQHHNTTLLRESISDLDEAQE